MSGMTETKKWSVELWEMRTQRRRRKIVIEAPGDLDAEHLSQLNGEELSDLADECGCTAVWKTEYAWREEVDSKIGVERRASDAVAADVVFVRDETGDLVDYGSGEAAPLLD
ncbi:MAG: hypothetical protein WD049_09995 [Candidatus Paceibacterota bacterium]